MTEFEEKIQTLVETMLENQPRKTSDRYFSGDTDDITTGTSLTVTWTLNKLWVTRLTNAYADSRTGCTYTWLIDGKSYSLNKLEFYQGKPITGETIVLVIANTSGSTQTVGYYIMGWGDLIGVG
jgi:hypothetical protein